MNANSNIECRADQLWFGNTLVKIAISAADGADGLCVIEHHAPLGEAPPLHVHQREDEIFILLAGEMRFQVGDQTIRASAGDRLLAPKGIAHAFCVVSPAGARFLTVTRGQDFETMVRAAGRPALSDGLPDPVQPTPDMIAGLVQLCAANRIDIIGPPIA